MSKLGLLDGIGKLRFGSTIFMEGKMNIIHCLDCQKLVTIHKCANNEVKIVARGKD